MQYAAFLRGVMPGNPNMRNEKLRDVFESLSFSNVHSVISSGNIIFETKKTATEKLERATEKALSEKLGIKGAVIVWSKDELEALVESDPFKGKAHSRDTYLLVTFLKDRTQAKGGYIATTLNVTDEHAPDTMSSLEKKYGKNITSRTWKTIGRIIAKFDTKK